MTCVPAGRVTIVESVHLLARWPLYPNCTCMHMCICAARDMHGPHSTRPLLHVSEVCKNSQ